MIFQPCTPTPVMIDMSPMTNAQASPRAFARLVIVPAVASIVPVCLSMVPSGNVAVPAGGRGFDLAVEVLGLGDGGPPRTRQEGGHTDKNDRSPSTRGSYVWG